jgi:hypothetical protein
MVTVVVVTVVALAAVGSVVATNGRDRRSAAAEPSASPVDDHLRCAAWVDLTEPDCREIVNIHARSVMINGGLDGVAPGLGLSPARSLELLLRSGQVVYAREQPNGLWVTIHFRLEAMPLDPDSQAGFFSFASFERLQDGWGQLESVSTRLPDPSRFPHAVSLSSVNGRLDAAGSILMPVAKVGWAPPGYTVVRTVDGGGRIVDAVPLQHGFFALEEPRAGAVAFWRGDELGLVYGSVPVEDVVNHGALVVQHPAAAWTGRFRADADAFLRSGAAGIGDRLTGGSTAAVTRALERVLAPGRWRLLQRTEYRGSGGVLVAVFSVRSRTVRGALIFTYVKTSGDARVAAVSFAGSAEAASLLAPAA